MHCATKQQAQQLLSELEQRFSQCGLELHPAKTKKLNWRNRTELSLSDIANKFNPVLQGWLNYYSGLFSDLPRIEELALERGLKYAP